MSGIELDGRRGIVHPHLDDARTVRLDVFEDVVHNLGARKAKGRERTTEPGAT